MREIAQIGYFGGIAEDSMMNAYDLARSTQGMARVLQILGHYYLTGRIIHHAPASEFPVFISVPEEGSFKQTFYGTVAAGVVLISIEQLVVRTLDSWLPSIERTEQILKEEIEQTALLKKLVELHEDQTAPPISPEEEHDLQRRQTELDVVRSITAASFREVFRPIEKDRDVSYVQIYGGKDHTPIKPVTSEVAAVLESDIRDGRIRTITARVTGFSRTSKVGTAFSGGLKRGFRFEYKGTESRLPVQDIFSHSQYFQEDIIMEGEFLHFFDGTLKKMIVYYAGPAKGPAGS